MIGDLQAQNLILKWTNLSDGYRAEALRLERSDRDRHATSIAMLEAHAQAVDRCVLELRNLLLS